MSHKHKDREQVFAILRYDAFQEPSTPERTITVKEIVGTQELAEAEVERLSKVNAEKNCRYWYTPTRLFPLGKTAGTPEGVAE